MPIARAFTEAEGDQPLRLWRADRCADQDMIDLVHVRHRAKISMLARQPRVFSEEDHGPKVDFLILAFAISPPTSLPSRRTG
jgi:hypothetical protein